MKLAIVALCLFAVVYSAASELS